MSKIIVVSGASSGIGEALSKSLFQDGNIVYGLSRSAVKDNPGFSHIACDITKESEIDQAINRITKEQGHVDMLINCAGMGISGAAEHTSIESAKRIFEVNVFGLFLLTKKMIPLLRQSSSPKVINIGSVAGDLIIPFQTFYSMTKAAVHAFSEGLRNELRPFGIEVCSVNPGDTKTGFTQNREQPDVKKDEQYQDRIVKSIQRMEKDEQNGKSPMTVVKVVRKLLKKKHLPVKVTVGFEYKLFVFLKRLLPKRFESWILYQMYGK